MTVSTHSVAIDRIMSARESSPIAIFKVFGFREKTHKEAVFANTAATIAQARNNPDFLGLFHRYNVELFKELI